MTDVEFTSLWEKNVTQCASKMMEMLKERYIKELVELDKDTEKMVVCRRIQSLT